MSTNQSPWNGWRFKRFQGFWLVNVTKLKWETSTHATKLLQVEWTKVYWGVSLLHCHIPSISRAWATWLCVVGTLAALMYVTKLHARREWRHNVNTITAVFVFSSVVDPMDGGSTITSYIMPPVTRKYVKRMKANTTMEQPFPTELNANWLGHTPSSEEHRNSPLQNEIN